MAAAAPFEQLRRLERLGLEHGADLPAQEEARSHWTGVGFRIGGRHFVTPMEEVAEILPVPDLSRVPHARAWVRGIANVRGTLLPVMDLVGFLGLGAVSGTRLVRVLVIDQAGVNAGLLVDEVLGMRHFLAEEQRDADAALRESLGTPGAYVDGVFEHAGARWPVFSMAALAKDPAFLKVSE